MKHLILSVALIGSVASVSAFAQDVGTTSNDAQWVPPYSQPAAQKTRAQVYQEFLEAQRDGQLAYLKKTVYAHR
jgi:hypothetical protein